MFLRCPYRLYHFSQVLTIYTTYRGGKNRPAEAGLRGKHNAHVQIAARNLCNPRNFSMETPLSPTCSPLAPNIERTDLSP